MQQLYRAKTSDPLGRYYTEKQIGALLVGAMGLPHPNTVLDLGSGSGSLVQEAAKVWHSARFITVDIDEEAASTMLPRLKGETFKHHVADALAVDLADKLGLNWSEVDSALCNPPYIRPKWKKQFAEILEDAGLSCVLPHLGDVPADLLFVAQNLRFLRKNGRLGLILPDGIVAGEKYSLFRKTLIKEHRIERSIELPRRIFRNTDAQAHIVIISKNAVSNEYIEIQRLEEGGRLSVPYLLPTEKAVKRFDYSYVIKNLSHNYIRRIGDETVYIRRGSFSSSECKASEFPILHTTDISEDDMYVPDSFVVDEENIVNKNCVFAMPGDILVARVGRNLSDKVCMVRNGKVAISDCFLLLRVNEKYIQSIFSFLRSSKGRFYLNAASHGVSAKFITSNSLLELPF